MDIPSAAEVPQEDDQPQHVYFDLASESYTPQMHMDDLEHVRASGHDVDELYPLRTACSRADIVQHMLDRGYDKEVLDEKGATVLQTAAIKGFMDVVLTLLAAGADTTHRCHSGESSLDLAARGGHVEVARVFLEHGADVNDACGDGWTPLHHAAAFDKPEMVSLLCLNGAR